MSGSGSVCLHLADLPEYCCTSWVVLGLIAGAADFKTKASIVLDLSEALDNVRLWSRKGRLIYSEQ
jgi:hypothetical protein